MHRLITGRTLSGKTALARILVAEAQRQGVDAIIHDPMLSFWGDKAAVYETAFEFMRAICEATKIRKPYIVVVDEADIVLSMGHQRYHWLLTRGRHYGFKVIVLTQRPALVAPTVRGQCTDVAVFKVSKKDAKLLADDYACEAINDAVDLRQGEFLQVGWVDGQIVAKKMCVFRC